MRGHRRITSRVRAWRLIALALAIGLRVSKSSAQQSVTPQSVSSHVTLAAADSAFAAGNAARAEHAYRAVLQADPASSRAAYQLAQLTSDRDESVRLLRRYVALEPKDAWGYIALGDALARAGDVRAGLSAYDAAGRLAPGTRDVVVGRARLLARAGHTDAAIHTYEEWTAAHAEDGEAWRELAAQRVRAGRPRGAIEALNRAHAARPDARTQQRIDALRAATAPWVEATAGGSRDSDDNLLLRTGISGAAMLRDAFAIRFQAGTAHARDPGFGVTLYDASAAVGSRPTASLRLDARAGIAWADSLTTARRTAHTVGELRLDWREAGGNNSINLRAARVLVTASPTLIANAVRRDEIGLRADREVVGPLRVRGIARAARISASTETNRRMLFGGGLVLAGVAGEISAIGQRIDFAHPSTSGYFAPRSARVAEIGTYAERETEHGVRVALDLGAGAQQVAQWGAAPGKWSPAYRVWSELAFALAAASELRIELEAYDASIGSELAPNGKWRYGSATLAVRWALR